MLKRTLFFENPCRLSLRNQQLIISFSGEDKPRQAPIEDLGVIIIENEQIQISIPCLNALVENNVAVIFCNEKHLPASMLMNLDGNHVQGEVFRNQIAVSQTLKNKLWQQTIEAKIKNQMQLLKSLNKDYLLLKPLYQNVKSGDSDNREGAAARIYWQQLFGNEFVRDRYGDSPNSLLNYGYTLLRAATARSLIGSGLLPSLGIFHKNKYNAYPLADDIMEPYRPVIDSIVYKLFANGFEIIDKSTKAELLKVMVKDVKFKKSLRPLMVGMSQTTASLARCVCQSQKKIEYPDFVL